MRWKQKYVYSLLMDNKELCERIKEFLEDDGCAVECANNR